MNVYIEGDLAHEDFVAIEPILEAFGDFVWDAAREKEPDAALIWLDEAHCLLYSHHFVHVAFDIGQLSVRSPYLFAAADTDLSRSPDFIDLLRRADARILHAPTAADAVQEFCYALYGIMPYRKYLQSSRWAETRFRALRRADERCQLCNTEKKPLHVHHRTYERRGHERDDDLIALCAHCHAKFHDKLPKGGE